MPEIPSTPLLSQLNKILKRRKKESLWSWLSLCSYLSCLYIIYVLKYIYMSCNNSLLFQVLKNPNKTSFSSKSVYFTALSYHQVAWYYNNWMWMDLNFQNLKYSAFFLYFYHLIEIPQISLAPCWPLCCCFTGFCFHEAIQYDIYSARTHNLTKKKPLSNMFC